MAQSHQWTSTRQLFEAHGVYDIDTAPGVKSSVLSRPRLKCKRHCILLVLLETFQSIVLSIILTVVGHGLSPSSMKLQVLLNHFLLLILRECIQLRETLRVLVDFNLDNGVNHVEAPLTYNSAQIPVIGLDQLGAGRIGEWRSPSTLRLTVTNATGGAPASYVQAGNLNFRFNLSLSNASGTWVPTPFDIAATWKLLN